MAEECSGRRTIAFSRSVARSFAREQARQKMEMRRRERSQEGRGSRAAKRSVRRERRRRPPCEDWPGMILAEGKPFTFAQASRTIPGRP
jgi:hypothetical protein